MCTGVLVGKQRSKKRAHKNKREREGKKRKRAKAEAQAAVQAKDVVLSGKVQNRQCNLELLIRAPGSTEAPARATAIVDTGATSLAIRADLVQKLRLPVIGYVEAATPTGTEQCTVVAAELFLQSGNRTIGKTVQAVVYPNMIDPILFGMAEMVGGVLKVDMIKRVWELRYKEIDSISHTP